MSTLRRRRIMVPWCNLVNTPAFQAGESGFDSRWHHHYPLESDGKAERRLALRTDEDFRKNLTFQKIFDIIYIQNKGNKKFLKPLRRKPASA